MRRQLRRRFRAAGGEMITYHGWSDTALNPLMAVNDDMLAETPEATDFCRLFMVPGMFPLRARARDQPR